MSEIRSDHVKLLSHSKNVVSIRYSNNGNLLATASADKECHLYNTYNGNLLYNLEGHSIGLNDCCFISNNLLATASDDKTVKIWDIETNKVIQTLIGHKSFVYSISVNPINQCIVSGGYDGTVHMFDIVSGQSIITPFDAHCDPVSSVNFSSTGKEYVTGSHDGLVRIWDSSRSSICKKSLYSDNSPAVSCVNFSYGGEFLLVSTLDDTHRLYNNQGPKIQTKCLKSYKGHVNKRYSIFSAMYISQYGNMIVSGSDDKKVYLWDIKTGKLLKKLEGHSDSVLAVACNPNQFQIASGGRDNNVSIWNLSYEKNDDMEQDNNIDISTDINKYEHNNTNDNMDVDNETTYIKTTSNDNNADSSNGIEAETNADMETETTNDNADGINGIDNMETDTNHHVDIEADTSHHSNVDIEAETSNDNNVDINNGMDTETVNFI